MKQKVSDYIADRLAQEGICQVFTVTGGGAMHLNDSLGHHPGLSCLYQHHEQAAAMAAEAYARVDNRMAAVCVTSGPGATNAITGALCAWMDSIPMIVLSGQVRYDTTVRHSGLKIRTMGVQEYDITPSVEPMTKYAVMVTDPLTIRYHLERAIYLAKTGRPGPCWLDLPLNIQSAIIETDDLRAYDPKEDEKELPAPVTEEMVKKILEKLKQAVRPVIFAGHGIRLAGAYDSFQRLVELLGIPVVTGMSSIDLMESAHPLYVGRNGGTGNRPGNFAVQTCDVLFSIGSRQSFLQTGFAYEKWAAHAYTILNDIDGEELKKETLHVDLPVVADAKELIEKCIHMLEEAGCSRAHPWFADEKESSWREKCRHWREKYPVVTEEKYKEPEPGRTNIYAFYDSLSKVLPNGEGCMQMNLQELQTIRHHNLPIRIFVINNEGYHSIRQTQTAYFGGHLVGVGEESGDLSFPDLSRLAPAYGFAYKECRNSATLEEDLRAVMEVPAPVICQVFVSKLQKTEPKLASRQLPDGTMVSASLEDMYPFLSREEMEEEGVLWKE